MVAKGQIWMGPLEGATNYLLSLDQRTESAFDTLNLETGEVSDFYVNNIEDDSNWRLIE